MHAFHLPPPSSAFCSYKPCSEGSILSPIEQLMHCELILLNMTAAALLVCSVYYRPNRKNEEKGYSDILGFLTVMAEMLDNQGKQI